MNDEITSQAERLNQAAIGHGCSPELAPLFLAAMQFAYTLGQRDGVREAIAVAQADRAMRRMREGA